MTAIERLFAEHDLILQVTDAFARFVERLESDGQDRRSDLTRLMTFFREFADLLHHEKEESVLLPALVNAGLRWDDGVIAEVRKDHELERGMLQTLRDASQQSSPWSVMDTQRVIDVGRRFTAFMRQHVATENDRLQPLLSARLDATKLHELDTQLDRFDTRHKTISELNVLRDLAANLCREYQRA